MATRCTALILLLFSFYLNGYGQPGAQDSVLPYLHGVRSMGALTLNVRGCEVIVEEVAGDLSKPYFAKMFPRFGLHQGYRSTADSSFGQPAFRVEQQESKKRYSAGTVFYFFQKAPGQVLGVAIRGYKAQDQKFQQALAGTVLAGAIPDTLIVSEPSPVTVLRFAGRTVPVKFGCHWMGPAVLQCPEFGEINWSLHPGEAEAREVLALQIARNDSLSAFTVEENVEVPVVMEGAEVEARRIQYRLKGVRGTVAKQAEGSRTLIGYYLTAPVRGRWVSFAGSYWTSDYLEPGGLPPLLNAVMQLKK